MIDYLEQLMEEPEELLMEEPKRAAVRKRTAENQTLAPENPAEKPAWQDLSSETGRIQEEPVREGVAVPLTNWAEEAEGVQGKSWDELRAGEYPAGVGLLEEMKRAARAAERIHTQQNGVTVTLPEEKRGNPQMDILAFDRAVERDARRYDGGFSLY